ncbi:lysine transporter LysE [Photobacterium damselae subsp. piscicida]|uniref:LysE family transporter n=1 Tax=Photobacterium damsela subsp. piscicida TaxID=38294 RepID=A0A1V1VG39_PHODP|nr:LysE family transporter [Photobacterium damselae]MBE8126736.1 LysE family transporter [Photobacterium damselae subsp. piscicida]MDP2513772.1 LysE family transporter [Photobacterium damselae subsp. piscicida]PSV50772.1 lysine transporter LysE [Photobacterium damselae]PSW75718.1 lysine transporter LysE [Photobacterium damselae]QOD54472.1 LysE family transporter [Photobacterium damselae subsp. piscicida]
MHGIAYFDVFLHVLVVWSLAAITPGANVFLTINTSLASGKVNGLACALGVTLAVGLWGLAGISGIVIMLSLYPWLFTVMKILGGAYLIYLGFSRFKTVRRGYQLAGQVEDKHSWSASAIRSFTTSILNIKTGLFVISLFSLAIPREHDYRVAILVIATMMLITFVWHCLLAFVFSHSRAQKAYFRLQRYIDALCGGCFIFVGVNLII